MKSILQTSEWAELKAKWGIQTKEIAGHFTNRRTLPAGQSLIYLPEISGIANINQIKSALQPEIDAKKPIFVRFEFTENASEDNKKTLSAAGLTKSFEEMQPKWRQIININQSNENILAQMKQKGRYNIKVASRHNVSVSVGTGVDRIDQFYKLYLETAAREGISSRPEQYFADLVDILSKNDYVAVFVASLGEEFLAAAIVTFYDGVASYLYGGSSSEHRSAMAPYALHWEVMKFAKERGCHSYDMLGRSAPETEQGSWAGVTRFKEQFGGSAVEVEGSWDWVIKPTWYRMFKIVESRRRSGRGLG